MNAESEQAEGAEEIAPETGAENPPPEKAEASTDKYAAIASGLIGWIIAFLIIAVLQWPHRSLPYYWDALGYVYSHSHDIYANGFNPILMKYDVGHPTLFFVLHALAIAVVGVGPFAGHLVTWAFGALLCVAVYGLGRRLRLPRDVAGLAAAVVLCYPHIYSSLSQICLDLPLGAAMLAAFWAFAGRRWGWYIFFGCVAALTKAYGFIVIGGTFGAVLFSSGYFWRAERRGDFLKRAAISWTPILAYLGYVGLRRIVRGPGAFVNHVTGSNIHLPNEWELWRKNLSTLWAEQYQATLVDHLLALLFLLVIFSVGKYFYLRKGRAQKNNAPSPASIWPVLAILLSYPLVSAAAFSNLSGLTARYMIPATACLLLMGIWMTWYIIPKRAVMFIAYVPAIAIFIILWHPNNAAWLPEGKIRNVLTRGQETHAWRLEVDHRFHDAVDLMALAGEIILQDSEKVGKPAQCATQWPTIIAFQVPEMGYVRKQIPTQSIESWYEVTPHEYPYVLEISPIHKIWAEPEVLSVYEAELIATDARGHCTMRLWRLEPRG